MLYPDKKDGKSAELIQKGVDKVTRIVAIAVAFISVFIFFFKLLFF